MVVGGAHFVGLIDDHQIPARAEQALAGVFDNRNPRDRRDDLVPLLPGVLSVVGPQNVAANDVELLTELVRDLALPLEGEVGRRDDEDAANEATSLELFQQSPAMIVLPAPDRRRAENGCGGA